MSELNPTDYERLSDARREADAVLDLARKVYPNLGARDFYKQAILRSMVVIIKLLIYIARKV